MRVCNQQEHLPCLLQIHHEDLHGTHHGHHQIFSPLQIWVDPYTQINQLTTIHIIIKNPKKKKKKHKSSDST